MKNMENFRCMRRLMLIMVIVALGVMNADLCAMPQPGDSTNSQMPGMPDLNVAGSGMPSPEVGVGSSEAYEPAGFLSSDQQANQQPTEVSGFKVNTVLGGLGVENSPKVNRLVQEAEETARRLELDVEAKVASLKKVAEESVSQMKADVEQQVIQLKREAEAEAQRARQRADRYAENLFKQAAEQAGQITQKMEDEAIELKKDAVSQVMSIVDKADEEALKLRKQEREEALMRHLSREPHQIVTDGSHRLYEQRSRSGGSRHDAVSKQPVPREWRRAMAKEFNANTLLMKQIIVEGEDAEQLPDFLTRFNEQHTWFDNTLRGTQYVGDDNYRKVVDKQVRLRKVVEAQRKADSFLADVVQKIKLSEFENKKIRLLSLYELNSFAQRELFKAGVLRAEFSMPMIQQLVLKVAHEVTGRVKQGYPDFKALDDKAILKLASGTLLDDHATEVKKLTLQVDDAKRQRHETRSRAQQKHEEQGKELAEYQLTAKRLERELDRLRNQTAADHVRITSETQERMKREFSVRLEEKERDSLDLKLQLTSAHQKLDVLDRQVKEAKENLDRMNIELLMAKDDARVAKKHVDELQKELEQQRKLKTLALDKVALIDEVAERRIDEHVVLAAKRMSSERRDLEKLDAAVKEKEEALKKAERELKEKEQFLTKKEQDVEEQRKSLNDMRKNINKDRDEISGIRDEAKVVMSKFSQLARDHEKEMASMRSASQVVTEAANKQALKSELKDKKQEQRPETPASMGTVSAPASQSDTKKM